ncbi:MAG: hypothetical protein FRX49_02027 [Trebouxia sp. A1-2]|nr:MAG: hypothetical protein FRX49_13042 [Trebouxia sp. A1-2]KAA6427363.1 MAG: hypothetical protein FRX49_02027 [Trebouxia sp. A1-2]
MEDSSKKQQQKKTTRHLEQLQLFTLIVWPLDKDQRAVTAPAAHGRSHWRQQLRHHQSVEADWALTQPLCQLEHQRCQGQPQRPLLQRGPKLKPRDLLRASMMPPENTRAKMDSTPTVEAMIGSRPTAAQPLNRALDAMLIKSISVHQFQLTLHARFQGLSPVEPVPVMGKGTWEGR